MDEARSACVGRQIALRHRVMWRSCRSEGATPGGATAFEAVSARLGYSAAASMLARRVRL